MSTIDRASLLQEFFDTTSPRLLKQPEPPYIYARLFLDALAASPPSVDALGRPNEGWGMGTYAYVTGELSSVEQASVDKVWSATQSAVKDLQFTVKEQSKDALQGRLDAEQADKTDITIKVERESETLTKVRIRVGVFGDEATSRIIMDKIKSKM